MPPVRSTKKNSHLESNAQQLSIESFFTKGVAKDASTSIANPPVISVGASPAAAEAPADSNPPDNSAGATSAAVGALADSNTPPPVKKVANAFQALRPDSKGQVEVYFQSDAEWEKSWQTKLGHRTKKLGFGSSFVLTDRHFEQLISIGTGICRNLTHFEFQYTDVSYGAHNANELTPGTTVRLARMYPCQLAFQLSGPSANKITQASFDALLAHPNWAPKLKTLCIPPPGPDVKREKAWFKSLCAVSKERQMLTIQVTRISEEKKWGDWELTTSATEYRKGKKLRVW
ncbi:uncharacterized protein G6M90_00g063520 [Metarhizium brunneum]|uniref:Uncharacterized protein n=1 Tax=Metarhizium brunneum TaxID=500148 RepID=A0A7D5UWQ6_9HYPO|nr:hypothetical protein G6M90_00g063520 [Metarhizium brunneum]